MIKKEFIPYTYLIGWRKHNLWYYGVEYANSSYKIANPENLWSIYFTSSIPVSWARSFFGDPDVIEIRRTFKTAEEAWSFEEKVLRRMRVVKSQKWLNENDRRALPLCKPGRICSPETRRKIGDANAKNPTMHRLGCIVSDETNAKIKATKLANGTWSPIGELNGMFGRKHSIETRKKISDANRAYFDSGRRPPVKGIPFTFRGVSYISFSHAERETGLSRYKLEKLAKLDL